MKAKIDEGCIGCGQCADTCPEVFRMNDEDLAEVYAEVTADTQDSAEEAADSCPVGIISIED
ncbi:MAG: ferredoxin [Bacilli bacterium]|nr:ferredoxin [Bacilli bacterium]